MSDNLSIEDIAHALGEGKEFRNGDDSWNTVCPAHSDKGPSLTLSFINNRVLVHCHAGCSQTAVIDALKGRDLWPRTTRQWVVQSHAPADKRPPSSITHPRLGPASASWTYYDIQGRLVGVIARFEKVVAGKTIKELAPLVWGRDAENGKQQWCWKGFNKPRPLYRGQLLSSNPTWPVLVVEGEKTADAAAKLVDDHVVVTWPGGGKAVKYVQWEHLAGREVVIWPDNDEPGFKAARSLAEILISVGATSVRIVDVPKGLPEGWDLADKCPDAVHLDIPALLARSVVHSPESGDVIEKFNSEFALVLVGDKTTILWEKPHDELAGVVDIKFVAVQAFQQMFGNQYVQLGRKEDKAPNYWLGHERRRSYHGVVFEPGRQTNRDYNLWRGFSCDPDPDGDWSLFDEHLRENIAQGDESLYKWVLGWFAQMIQQPRYKPGTSISLRGHQGSGKTIVGQHIGALFPQHYILVDDPRYVIGNFNAHMASTLLLHADEAFFAGDPRHSGRLKGMVTSTTNRIEPKGKDSFEVKNYMRLFISTNNAWVIPAGFEERRFAVLDVGDGRLQDKAFFIAMERQLKNGGYEGLLHHLLHLDLSTTEVGIIPATAALLDQKIHSLDSVPRFWYERLRDGEIMQNKYIGWPGMVSSEELYQAYLQRANQWGERRRVSDIQFGRELKVLLPGCALDRRKMAHKFVNNQGFQESVRTWGYEIPPLELCRLSFDKATRSRSEWPDVTDHGDVVQLAKKDAVPF